MYRHWCVQGLFYLVTMATTAQELLDAVNAAILAIIGGAQSYSIGSRAMTKADLGELREMRKELEVEVGRETGTRKGPRVRPVEFG